jgi:hypothetical protein
MEEDAIRMRCMPFLLLLKVKTTCIIVRFILCTLEESMAKGISRTNCTMIWYSGTTRLLVDIFDLEYRMHRFS